MLPDRILNVEWRTPAYRLLHEGEFSPMVEQAGGPFLPEFWRPEFAEIAPHWQQIRDEFEAVSPTRFLNYGDTGLPNDPSKWKLLPLFAWGAPVAANTALCPKTTAHLQSIPGMVSAAFSALHPGTDIRPHRGAPQGVVRCHLGLRVPPGCGLEVHGETRSWQEGRWLNFDDACLHRAWNFGPGTRVVLIVDVVYSPDHRRLLHRAVLGAERAFYLWNRWTQV